MGFLTKEKQYNLEPMLTPEQQEAMRLLMQYGQTGQLGNVQAGQGYQGSLGNYQMTGTEQMSLDNLNRLLQGGTPTSLATAERTLTGMADNTFNPQDPSSGYAAFQRQLARATGESNDLINREAAITGSRFGDRILNTKSDLAMQQSDLLASKLAELFNAGQNRALTASQGLTNLAGVGNQIQLDNIRAGTDIGSLQRLLDTAKAQAQYGEWQRARQERLGAIGGVTDVFNRDIPYGLKSYTDTSSTPWGTLLNAGLTAAGTALGGPIGGMIGNTVGGMVTNASGIGSGNVAGTGIFGTRLGGKTQSELLGINTKQYM